MKHLGTLVLGGALTLASLPSWQRYEVLTKPQTVCMPKIEFYFGRSSETTDKSNAESDIDFLNHIQEKHEASVKQGYKPQPLVTSFPSLTSP